jgi:hypothetical protein
MLSTIIHLREPVVAMRYLLSGELSVYWAIEVAVQAELKCQIGSRKA